MYKKMFKILTSRLFLVVFGTILAAGLSYTYISSESSLSSYSSPLSSYHSFLSMSTLDSQMMAEKYYSTDGRSVKIGDSMNWNVNIYNHMGNTEYLSVRVKLLNLTQQNPDDKADSPSSAPSILTLTHVSPNNSTWTIPISWSVKDAIQDGDNVIIRQLSLNGATIDGLNLEARGGKNFRIVFELWRYNPDVGDFVFAWTDSNAETKSVWNQTWFDLKVSN